MSRMLRLTACLTLTASAVVAALRADDPPWIARGKTGMIASDSAEASQIGAIVLATGGNAFDAAVATSFALAVARPESTGLGGGGFMVAYVAKEKRFVALDFRETAPAGATPERYAKLFADRGDGPSPSIYGGNAVAVPGQLAGLVEINKRYGTKPLRELVMAAAMWPDVGFAADEHFLDARRETIIALERHPELDTPPSYLNKLFFPRGVGAERGTLIPRPQLAKALRLIAEEGPDALYNGPIGEALVAAVRKAGGVMTMDDLRGYRVVERKPIRGTYHDLKHEHEYEIVSMPPPSSGGVCLTEILNIVQATRDRSDFHPVHDHPHVLVEAMKHAFADRARWLGDPDFCEIPSRQLTSRSYAIELASGIASRGTRESSDYGSAAIPPDDGGTSHFCVADKHGNIVAMTETINGSFGSLVVAEPYGIILNNEMDDFLTVRGEANLYGLVQSERNLVAPAKRPLSSMSPTIIVKDGKPMLVLGASGGPRIISSVLQVALNVMDARPLADAMTALRLHHQWQPDEIFFDHAPPTKLARRLQSCGHTLSDERRTGIVQAIQLLDDGTMVGASDPKKGGRPAGVP